MPETITLTTDARGVARLTLNRPDKHNALNALMIGELTRAAAELAADPAVRVVVLTGAGASFCAGGDLGWMRGQMAADDATRAVGARALAQMLRALNELPQPLIGRVQGQAFGGGVGMMAVCDLCIGVDSALFGLTETRLGLIPATIGPYVVARIGESAARRVFMNGRRFDAGLARDIGLLARVVPAAALETETEEEVAPYLACAPRAVARAKALVRALGPRIDDATVAMTVSALVETWQDPEATEGITAFLDRRKPGWVRD
ncbi:MAG: crotonase/enoyl-CoA hydratase family protein [Rhodobacter sp.]|nr:crotonase/enoyl-CoA hydratase family protein [Rhodobacter sp.]